MRRISLHSEKDWIGAAEKTKDLSEYRVCTELGSMYIRLTRLWKVSLRSVSVMKAYGSVKNVNGILSKNFSYIISQDAVVFI